MEIRAARPAEYPAVGALSERVYLDGGFVAAGSPYVGQLRDAANRAAQAELLVAVGRADKSVIVGQTDQSITAHGPGQPGPVGGAGESGDADAADALLGSVTFAFGGRPYAEIAGDDEALFRMLVVDRAARRQGVGTALVQACIDRATRAGMNRLVLSTQPTMDDACRIYLRLGFVHSPGRDWSPVPSHELHTYVLELR